MTDPRLCCEFCDEPTRATMLAPQHTGGDVDRPAHWVPVCDEHFANWYADVGEDERLPVFVLPAP
jgi:hypothetical protein